MKFTFPEMESNYISFLKVLYHIHPILLHFYLPHLSMSVLFTNVILFVILIEDPNMLI